MQQKPYESIGETLYTAKPENGPQIFVPLRPGYTKSFALFAVRYGGNDLHYQWDKQWKTLPAGTAHFLEHKLFDTKEGGADQMLAAKGAQSNAFTSPFMTAYYFECTENFEECLKILLQFVSEPYFTAENVAKEQGIIGQEIHMGLDNPEQMVYYNLLDCLYAGHPIKDRVIGSVESIGTITPELLYECHTAFYHPSNMVLCAAGDILPEKVEEIVLETLRPGPGKAPARDYGPAEAPTARQPRREENMDVSAPIFLLGWKEPPSDQDPLEEQLLGDLACELLFGSSSPLYAKLYAQGLIDKEFGYGFETYPGCCFLLAGGESRDPDAVAAAIFAERDRIAGEGLDEALFNRLKKASFGARLQSLNSLENTCVALADAYFQGYSYFDFPTAYLRLTKSRAEQFILQAFSPERSAISIVRPGGRREG